MELNNPWYREAIALAGLLAAGLFTYFVRFIMGQNKRIQDLERQTAVLNTHLENIEKNIQRGVNAIERMEERHRQDIVRAYEHIESLHVIVIEHLAQSEKHFRRIKKRSEQT